MPQQSIRRDRVAQLWLDGYTSFEIGCILGEEDKRRTAYQVVSIQAILSELRQEGLLTSYRRKTIMTRYKRIYELLKSRGHSPAKAAEIIIDASRGDKHALTWIKVTYRGRHS